MTVEFDQVQYYQKQWNTTRMVSCDCDVKLQKIIFKPSLKCRGGRQVNKTFY